MNHRVIKDEFYEDYLERKAKQRKADAIEDACNAIRAFHSKINYNQQ